MREEEFRRRLQDAVGEPPPLASPVVGPRAASPRLYPRAMAFLAAAVAVLLVVVLVASRVALQPRGATNPASSPRVAQLPPDSFPCHLAVLGVSEAGNPGQPGALSTSAGFVNIPSGNFTVDPHASVTGLPGADPNSPGVYSAALERWLPASLRTLSPDGRSYVYRKLVPAGATFSAATGTELHIVDASNRTDRNLVSRNADLEIIDWTSLGILASTVPFGGGIGQVWLIDPTTGTLTEAPRSADPQSFNPSSVYPDMHNWSYFGTDAAGLSIYRLGSRDPGTKFIVLTVDAAGNVTTIYAGTQGDATGFDPDGMSTDAHGLWTGNYGGSRIWLWSGGKLKSFDVSGTPPAPKGYEYFTFGVLPAGPCIPGLFNGTHASALAPAPSPSPIPSVNWAPLLARPVHLPEVTPDASCPVTPQVNLNVTVKTGSGGKGGPSYGYGQGPAYLSGQVSWYSAGSQGVLVLTDPRYKGPVLVRVKRLDGAGGSLGIAGDAGAPFQDLGDGAVGIPVTSSPPYWGVWFGVMAPTAPGCYGIQFDGTTFSEYVVIQVKKGPPPPG